MSSKKLNPFKDFQSDQIQRSSRKIFTAHYACRNAALNLTPVTGTTNRFIFQIINSLIESWGVRLTWFDCNNQINHRVLLLSELRGAVHFYLKGPFNTFILFSLLFGMKGLKGCHNTCNWCLHTLCYTLSTIVLSYQDQSPAEDHN